MDWRYYDSDFVNTITYFLVYHVVNWIENVTCCVTEAHTQRDRPNLNKKTYPMSMLGQRNETMGFAHLYLSTQMYKHWVKPSLKSLQTNIRKQRFKPQ